MEVHNGESNVTLQNKKRGCLQLAIGGARIGVRAHRNRHGVCKRSFQRASGRLGGALRSVLHFTEPTSKSEQIKYRKYADINFQLKLCPTILTPLASGAGRSVA
jgi:hypothetical protein